MAAYVARNDKAVLPSSHEDGKLSKTQRITHTEILALGHKIFQKNNANQRELFNEEITKLKNDLLKKAEEEKDLAVRKAEKTAAENMKNAMDDAKARQDMLVKDEAKRVKEVMKQIAIARVEQERKDGEERMKIALQRQREEFDVEKSNAVLEARQKEQYDAAEMLNELVKEQEEAIARLKKEAEEIKQNELRCLERKMKTEKEDAIQQTKDLLQKEAEKERKEMCRIHDEDVKLKQADIERKQQRIDELLEELKKEQDLHMKTKEKLQFVIKSFQEFIDCQPGFSKGQADYVLKDFIVSL